jgi:two-component system response regulator HydG
MVEQARILVVDDDESIRKVLRSILEEKGYITDTAETGKEAIQKTQSEFYNLALVDIRLPDMDGTEVLASMKETTPPMVKMIVTGYPSLQNAIDAVNNGADAYILKPFKVDNILNTISEHLKKQKENKKYSERKILDFIQTRARELDQERVLAHARSN